MERKFHHWNCQKHRSHAYFFFKSNSIATCIFRVNVGCDTHSSCRKIYLRSNFFIGRYRFRQLDAEHKNVERLNYLGNWNHSFRDASLENPQAQFVMELFSLRRIVAICISACGCTIWANVCLCMSDCSINRNIINNKSTTKAAPTKSEREK